MSCPRRAAPGLSLDRDELRRLAADELGLPTAPVWFAGSVEELTALAVHVGFPLLVKPVAVVGSRGESVLLPPEDVEAAAHAEVVFGQSVAGAHKTYPLRMPAMFMIRWPPSG
jgi:phosphoribosylglycinamide formyltransferase 2